MLCPCGEVQVRQCVVKVMGRRGARQFYAGSRLLTLIAVAMSYLGFKSGSPRPWYGDRNKAEWDAHELRLDRGRPTTSRRSGTPGPRASWTA
jgi:hypothetical protein